jgi:transposase
LKKARDRKIRKLYGTGKKVRELAELFGVSQRTIQRALGSG